jgi:hypothetical protein
MDKICRTHGMMKNVCNNLVGRLKGRGHLEDLGVDMGIILKRIFKK